VPDPQGWEPVASRACPFIPGAYDIVFRCGDRIRMVDLTMDGVFRLREVVNAIIYSVLPPGPADTTPGDAVFSGRAGRAEPGQGG